MVDSASSRSDPSRSDRTSACCWALNEAIAQPSRATTSAVAAEQTDVEEPPGAPGHEHLGQDEQGQCQRGGDEHTDDRRPGRPGAVAAVQAVCGLLVDAAGGREHLVGHQVGRPSQVRRTDRVVQATVRPGRLDAPDVLAELGGQVRDGGAGLGGEPVLGGDVDEVPPGPVDVLEVAGVVGRRLVAGGEERRRAGGVGVGRARCRAPRPRGAAAWRRGRPCRRRPGGAGPRRWRWPRTRRGRRGAPPMRRGGRSASSAGRPADAGPGGPATSSPPPSTRSRCAIRSLLRWVAL